MRTLPLLGLFAVLGFAIAARAHAGERRSFLKASPVEVAYQVDTACFAREIQHGAFVQVDPFICEQLGAEEQRRADLRRMRFPRPTAGETSSSYGGGY